MRNNTINRGKLNDYNRDNNVKYNSIIKNQKSIDNRNKSLNNKNNSIINKEKYNENKKVLSNSKNNLIVLFLITLLVLLSSPVFAIPDSLTLQGKLTDLTGASQVGTFNFTFRIYDSFTGGTTLYQVINRSVKTDTNGIYDVILYNLSSLNFSDQYFLGIAIQGDNESKPRINLTSAPYSFRANISEDLNKENAYTVAVFNITGNLTVGEGSADSLTVTTGRLNISDGSITLGGNLTLAERITFSLGAIIDNLVNGFLRISSGLNVTGNVSIAQDTLFVDNTSSFVGIGTASPGVELEVIGGVNISGGLNVTAGDVLLATSSGKVGIGTSSPYQELTVIGNINATGNITSGTGTIILDSTNDRIGVGTTLPSHALDVYGNVSIKGNLSVDSNLSVDGSTLFVDSLDNKVGIGTTIPYNTLTVVGSVGVSGSLNASSINVTGDAYFATSSGSVGIGTSSPTEKLTVIGNVNVSGYVNISGDLIVNKRFNVTAAVGDVDIAGGIEAGGGLNVSGDLKVNELINLTAAVGDVDIAGGVEIGRGLNVTDDATFDSGTLFVDSLDNRVGIGTTIPYNTLTVIGSVGVSGSLNASSINVTGNIQGDTLNITTTTENATFEGDVLIKGTLYGGSPLQVGGGINISGVPSGQDAFFIVNASGDKVFSINRLGSINISGPGNTSFDDTTLFIDAENNRVGIGTTSPATVLDVQGKLNVTGNVSIAQDTLFVDNTSSRVGIGTTSPAQTLEVAGTFNVTSATGRDTDLFVASDGKVGIGTAKPDNLLTIFGNEITSNAILHINASDNFNTTVINVITLDHVLKSPVNSTGGVGVSILFRATDNASQLSNIGNISAILYNATNGSQLSALTFSTRIEDTGDGSFGHLIERLRIDGHGRVGINTSAPNETLVVIGTLSVISGSGTLGLHQDSAGNIGIGTFDPNAKLEVNGTATIGGNLNIPNNDVNVGGGYSAGGITLIGQGNDLGSGQFAKDILLDGDIISIIDIEINQSFIPSLDLFSILGNLSQRWDNLFVRRIEAGNLTLTLDSNVTIHGNLSVSAINATGDLTLDSVGGNVIIPSGSVGIGTEAPTESLEVIGTVRVSGNVTGTSFSINETATAVVLSATGSKRLILTTDPSLWS